MENVTKKFYFDDIWQQIIDHPQYDIGRREQEALIRFLPKAVEKCKIIKNVLHLGVGVGREIPPIVQQIPVEKYVINDICPASLERLYGEVKKLYPEINFIKAMGDVEKKRTIKSLRRKLHGPTLFVLVANGVIFSNRQMDSNIRQAMKPDDLFLLTIETAHDKMFDSYLIKPVFKLLSQSGIEVNGKNVKIYYDWEDYCMKMSCQGKILLSSYKPKGLLELEHRIVLMAGFNEVAAQQYDDIHMIAVLFKKRS